MNWFSSTSRDILRWYLRKFPLRDGKTFFYQRFSPRLTPPERFVTAALDAGFSMKLDFRDAVQRCMYFYGDYDERYEAKMIRRLLDKGEIFWDIGANIGYTSLLAAATLQHTGRVIAFEPGQVAYARLLDNIALNPFRNITTFNLAVTDREEEAALYLAAETADGCCQLIRRRGRSGGPGNLSDGIFGRIRPIPRLARPGLYQNRCGGSGIIRAPGRPGDAGGFPAPGAGGIESRNSGSLGN